MRAEAEEENHRKIRPHSVPFAQEEEGEAEEQSTQSDKTEQQHSSNHNNNTASAAQSVCLYPHPSVHCICGCVCKRDSKRTNKNGAWHAHWASNLNLKLLYCCASRLFHLRYQRRRRQQQQQRWQPANSKSRERECWREQSEDCWRAMWRESERALASSRYVCMYACLLYV